MKPRIIGNDEVIDVIAKLQEAVKSKDYSTADSIKSYLSLAGIDLTLKPGATNEWYFLRRNALHFNDPTKDTQAFELNNQTPPTGNKARIVHNFYGAESEDASLPSRFQIGDEVIIRAKVKGVQFVDGKVSYCFWLDDKLHTITSDHVEASNGVISVTEAK